MTSERNRIPSSQASTPARLPGFLRRSLRTSQYETNLRDQNPRDRGHSSQKDVAATKSEASTNDNSKLASNNAVASGRTKVQGTNQNTTEQNDQSISNGVSIANTRSSAQRNGTQTQNNNDSVDQKDGNATPKGDKSSFREEEFKKIMTAPVVNLLELRKLAWNGIPPIYRAESWKLLLGYLPANASRREATLERKRADYNEAISQHYAISDNLRSVQEQETLRQVLVDVPRTAPAESLFRHDRVRRCLVRILYIWAMRHPASSYVQGINDLATPLFMVFLGGHFNANYEVLDQDILDEHAEYGWRVTDDVLSQIEADCYWCLTNLLAGIQDHYTCDQPGLQRMIQKLEGLVQRIDEGLCNYLKEKEIQFMQFAFKWMNCLLLREFNLRCVIRLWDTYLAEGEGGFEDFHVYVCAAFLCRFSAEMQAMEFDELFDFMQNIPTRDWGDREIEILLSQAYVLSSLFGGSNAHLTKH